MKRNLDDSSADAQVSPSNISGLYGIGLAPDYRWLNAELLHLSRRITRGCHRWRLGDIRQHLVARNGSQK